MPGPSWANPLSWPIHPLVLLGLEAALILYLRGGPAQAARRPTRKAIDHRPLAFYSALAVIAIALDTPLEWLAARLFWAHMLQHLLLLLVAAPLIALAAPGMRVWRGLPIGIRRPLARTVVRAPALEPLRAAWRVIVAPAGAWLAAALVLWAWHVPALYDLTLRSHVVHHVEHGLFLLTGVLFWSQVIDQRPFHSRLPWLSRAGFVFLGAIQSWALAAVLAFSGSALYAYRDLLLRPGGISAMQDQQIGAGIMWVPASIPYAIAFITCLFLWLRDEDRATVAGPAPATDRAAAQKVAQTAPELVP